MNPANPSSSLWRSLWAVLWSMLGVRKDSEFKNDLAAIKPLHVIVVGIVVVCVTVVSLMLFAQWMVRQH
ncbi:MAG: hypothetical protein RLZZ126_2016 [Pseudomonadota bacterium]|jgi:uncharacterized transporter YbjL